MSKVRTRRVRWRCAAALTAAPVALLAVQALAFAGSAQGAAATRAHALSGGTVYFAEPPGEAPDFIFPFMTSGLSSIVNTSDVQYLMYRPLYFFGEDGRPALDSELSLADRPVYSDGDRTVTITLKRYKWSDGEEVTASDVAFWLNMVKVEKLAWADYVKGALPDDITSVRVESGRKLSIELSGPVDESWFTYDELSQITPLPMAWDVAAGGQGPGSQACGTASYQSVAVSESSAGTSVTPLSQAAKSCAAVYTYLETESGYDPSTPASPNNAISGYATNRLWAVADGPFQLSSFDAGGKVVLLPNRSYSGPVRPSISQLVEVPYDTASAEFAALAAGQLTIGYLPYDDVTAPAPAPGTPGANNPRLTGYTAAPWYAYGINYLALNFASTGAGGSAAALLGELYFRQALQLLVDQPAEVRSAFKGYAVPTYGPVPLLWQAAFVDSAARQDVYPYDPARAVALLRSHGWAVRPGGTSVCTSAPRCGVPAGTTAEVTLRYVDSGTVSEQLVAADRASFAEAGITLAATKATAAALAGDARCKGAGCTWMVEQPETGWLYAPGHYPSGEQLFETGAAANVGSYSSTRVDDLITASEQTASDLSRYDAVVARELPVIWQPEPAYQITEVQRTLHGVTPQNPYLDLEPEAWYFTKS